MGGVNTEGETVELKLIIFMLLLVGGGAKSDEGCWHKRSVACVSG